MKDRYEELQIKQNEVNRQRKQVHGNRIVCSEFWIIIIYRRVMYKIYSVYLLKYENNKIFKYNRRVVCSRLLVKKIVRHFDQKTWKINHTYYVKQFNWKSSDDVVKMLH